MLGEGRMSFSDLTKLKEGDSVWECEYGYEIHSVLLEDAKVTETEDGNRKVSFKAKQVGSEHTIDYLSSENYSYPCLYDQRQIYTVEELKKEAEEHRREQRS